MIPKANAGVRLIAPRQGAYTDVRLISFTECGPKSFARVSPELLGR